MSEGKSFFKSNLAYVLGFILVLIMAPGAYYYTKNDGNNGFRKSLKFPKEEFAICEGQRDGHLLIMIVNQSLKDYPFKREFPWNLRIDIMIGAKEYMELPDSEEAKVLNGFEDLIRDRLKSVCKLHYIGRTTHIGVRELMFYADKPQKAHEELQTIINSKPIREFEYSIKKDENWGFVDYYYNSLKCQRK